MDEHGRLVVPREVVEEAGLEPGAEVMLEATSEGEIRSRRRSISDELDADIAARRLRRAHSLEDFAAELGRETPE